MYANAETLFPSDYASRLPFFVDNVHLSDQGQRRIAEYFAGYILHADQGTPSIPRSWRAWCRNSTPTSSLRPANEPPAGERFGDRRRLLDRGRGSAAC